VPRKGNWEILVVVSARRTVLRWRRHGRQNGRPLATVLAPIVRSETKNGSVFSGLKSGYPFGGLWRHAGNISPAELLAASPTVSKLRRSKMPSQALCLRASTHDSGSFASTSYFINRLAESRPVLLLLTGVSILTYVTFGTFGRRSLIADPSLEILQASVS
jgi:hypothetical protein